MKFSLAPATVFLAAPMLVAAALAIALPASAKPGRCIANGDIVTLDGIASRGAGADAHRPSWVLHLNRPMCVIRRARYAPVETIFAMRIIGTPPPLAVPLQLTGKLMLGGMSAGPTMFAALAVISGRKETNTRALSPGRSAPAASASAPPGQQSTARCGAPPYGGTRNEYQVFVRRFGHIIRPQKILAGICNAKFGSASRDGLHKLGFADARIDSESTERLAADTIVALKTLVNTIE